MTTSPINSVADGSPAPETESLLVSILPHRLQFLSIRKDAVPSLCFALLKLLLEAQASDIIIAHAQSARNCFFSYTETDEKDVSLLLDATLLSHFRQSLQYLPNMSISQLPTSVLSSPSPPSPIQLIGFPLRAIQVLEGYSGHVDTAIISSVSGTLAAAHFSIFYVSTNHADYVLVQEQQLEAVLTCLADKFLLIKEEMEGEEEEVMVDGLEEEKGVEEEEGRKRKGEGNHSESSEDEERMIREALRRSKRRHRKGMRKGSDVTGEGGEGGYAVVEEGIAEEESEGDEYSSKESLSSMTPPTSAFLTPIPHSPSPALSSLSLASSPSFSSLPSSRPLQLQTLPYTLILHSLAHTDLPLFFSSLLQLIFFPSTPLTAPRFFSYTMIDNDYSLITSPPSPPSPLYPAFTHSQQWSVIEALGVFRYDEAGLVSRISRPLSEAGLRFFYFSSWRTGFVIVHKEDEGRAKEALRMHFEAVS